MCVGGFSGFGIAGKDVGGCVASLKVRTWVASGRAVNCLDSVGEMVPVFSVGKNLDLA